MDVSNDIARCFDHMVEACQNLSCRQHSTDLQYLEFHAKAHRLFQYHVKHAHAVSTKYNTFTQESPWYCAGQGLGDAVLQWVVQADSLISAYHTVATPWVITSPNKSSTLKQGFDTFVGDTDIISATPVETNTDPIPIAQCNLNVWHELLQASSGELNPMKCVWLYFDWNFDAKGRPSIRKVTSENGPQITVTLCSKAPIWIRRLKHDEAHRYLGIQIMTDGNCKKEIELLKQCNQRYIQLLNTCPFSHHEIQIIYKQCYLPTVCYPLPATHILMTQIHKAQSSATTIFLMKLGYPRTFPWSVVYASVSRGRLGFRHLGYEQGIQKCMQLIKQMRANMSMGRTSQIILEHYQLMAGLSKPILEHQRVRLSWLVICQ